MNRRVRVGLPARAVSDLQLTQFVILSIQVGRLKGTRGNLGKVNSDNPDITLILCLRLAGSCHMLNGPQRRGWVSRSRATLPILLTLQPYNLHNMKRARKCKPNSYKGQPPSNANTTGHESNWQTLRIMWPFVNHVEAAITTSSKLLWLNVKITEVWPKNNYYYEIRIFKCVEINKCEETLLFVEQCNKLKE